MTTLRRRLRQALALGRVLREPGALAAIRSWRPFSITAFRMLRALHDLGIRPATVLDGGANAGQFARAAIETFPEADVIAIEPLPDLVETLRQNLADATRTRVEATALGSASGSLRFFRTDYSLASSALRPLDAAGVTEVEVPVTRLDDLVDASALARPVLLKLDLQGYELEALRGAEAVLAVTDHVLLEVAFETAYEGEATFAHLDAFLRERGFQFLRPVDTLRDEDRIVQMDALFQRVSPA
ncbi:MAG: FkbM family methyltransferase [Bacteroidota bacterium]